MKQQRETENNLVENRRKNEVVRGTTEREKHFQASALDERRIRHREIEKKLD